MTPLNDLKIMEEILYEYSLSHYRFELAGFYKGHEIHSEWVLIRTIDDYQFHYLEEQYKSLSRILNKEPRVFCQMTMNTDDEYILDILVKMTHQPSVLNCWPKGYGNLSEIVDSRSLEKRIEKLSQQKVAKQII